MKQITPPQPHSFYIPIMGTGFTVDTPLKVAKFGISSVVSLVDDILLEQMRKFYCRKVKEPYTAITNQDDDARARRITAYLNLLNRLITKQVTELQNSDFNGESDLTRYFKMLPQTPLKQMYLDMLAEQDPILKQQYQDQLRKLAVPGSIDVNIMTKLDRDHYKNGEKLGTGFSDALAALRGFANSALNSAVVLSAGFNPRLYNYIAQFKDFLPDEEGKLIKRIILKVSDYRSALIQGKYLAKHGLWVSEYRVESALNCGGHAFANDGFLLGPILEEFKHKRQQLITTLQELYRNALHAKHISCSPNPSKIYVTVQGGIGTCDEHEFLLTKYDLNAAGWGTPFLLVPEVVNIDNEHLKKLQAAGEKDVVLSDSSPLGIPYWNLMTSASEENRRQKACSNKPGSACPKCFARINTEFTKIPICIASYAYQKLKLLSLPKEGWAAQQLQILKEKILSKACICRDLAGGVSKKYALNSKANPAVCPGPNIINFSKIATLEEMIDHIYGRISLLTNANRPHMFIKELKLHIEYLKKEVEKLWQGLANRTQEKLQEVKNNLHDGITYYQKLAQQLIKEQQENFISGLNKLKQELENITFPDCKEIKL